MILERFTQKAAELNRGKKVLSEGTTLDPRGAHASLAECPAGGLQVTLANKGWSGEEDVHSLILPEAAMGVFKIDKDGQEPYSVYQLPIGTVASLGRMGMGDFQEYSAAGANVYPQLSGTASLQEVTRDPSQDMVYLQASELNVMRITTTPLT